jgi:hypothetical protein
MSAPSAVDITRGTWLFQELAFTWRDAQLEAVNAYCDWRCRRDGTAYAIYRAAQDRADAAQDALRDRWRADTTRTPT